MKEKIISYLKYSAAGLIASLADNLTYFLLNLVGVHDIYALIAARVVSLIVNFVLLRFAVFSHGRNKDSFPRYILLVAFSTTIVYFGMQFLKPVIPINPTWIKMGIEFIMNFFNYLVAKYIVFDEKDGEEPREA